MQKGGARFYCETLLPVDVRKGLASWLAFILWLSSGAEIGFYIYMAPSLASPKE